MVRKKYTAACEWVAALCVQVGNELVIHHRPSLPFVRACGSTWFCLQARCAAQVFVLSTAADYGNLSLDELLDGGGRKAQQQQPGDHAGLEGGLIQ